MYRTKHIERVLLEELGGSIIMANERKRKHIQKKKEEEMNFFSTKASFVSGIVLTITIIKDMFEMFITLPDWVKITYLAIICALFYFVLATNKFDNRLKSKQVSNYGSYLTVMSVIVFVIENTLIRYKEINADLSSILIVIIIGLVIMVSSLFLLFGKY